LFSWVVAILTSRKTRVLFSWGGVATWTYKTRVLVLMGGCHFDLENKDRDPRVGESWCSS
jgi:hypothetical protein